MTLSLTFRRAFPNNMSTYIDSVRCDFQRFLLFRNKSRNVAWSRKNAGMWEIIQNAGLSSTIAERWTVHRRTGQHPFGGADRVLPEWFQWGGVVAEIFRDPYFVGWQNCFR